MSRLLQALQSHAEATPHRLAVRSDTAACTYGQLNETVGAYSRELGEAGLQRIGLLADNGLPWLLADLAALQGGIPLIPLPLFFSPQQMLHAIRDSGMDGLLTDVPASMQLLLESAGIEHRQEQELHGLQLIRLLHPAKNPLPAGTAKITYTSGTTGDPKGVCLSREQMETVASSLLAASEANADDVHLCLTPLSTLLENIGGIYVPLLAGASIRVLPLPQVGLQGASALNVATMLQALTATRASTAILAPQMLQALVNAAAAGNELPATLRFVAVGGAPVSPHLLERAHILGLPVYEGYGLSECASVVALNHPGHVRLGSVGRPLPHVAISFAQDGEIHVSGSAFLGYLGQEAPVQPWPTGDLGYLDDDGYLVLTGRKKSQFITSFGRNVAPEWVERELTMQPAIAQAAVFGEARPFNVAVIVARTDASDRIDAAIAQANQSLPDYAQIHAWVPAHEPFTPGNGQLTSNGRLKREAILAVYGDRIATLYQEEMHDVF